MEGTAASFTQYATLHMYLLISIYGDYVNSTDSEVDYRWEKMRVYLEEIIHLGSLYYQYAAWMQLWAEQKNIGENYRCLEYPYFTDLTTDSCYMYDFECDPAGWKDITYKPPWKAKSINTKDYLTCWNRFNNMLPDNKCTQTLEVRVDGEGASWMRDNPDTVWSAWYDLSDPHEAGLREHRGKFSYRVVVYNDWDYYYIVDDIRNWWEANVLVEARKWEELHSVALDTYNREFGPHSTSGIQVNEAVYQQLKEELVASRQFK